jgi:type II restriction enzyme
LISSPEKEGDVYFIESDIKNQNKTTIKIRSNSGALIASRVDEPNHESKRKELNRGRLLFYVTFNGGMAYLDIDNLKETLGIDGEF